MTLPSVYLAGPIANLTFDEANAWRLYAIDYLADFGIRGRSPLRGKEFLKDLGVITIDSYTQAIASDEGIVARDRYDVEHCDVVLSRLLDAPKVSVGTPVEYGWADMTVPRTPMITVMEKEGSAYDHPFIRGLSAYRVETLDEGLQICVTLLS